MAAEKICHYEKYGYCKRKEECSYFHPKEICIKKECDIKNCRSRHPKECRFYKLGICKFLDSCKYDHKSVDDGNEIHEKIQAIENRYDKLNKLHKNQEQVIEILKEKIRSLESEVIHILKKLSIREEKKRKRNKQSESENIACESLDENDASDSKRNKVINNEDFDTHDNSTMTVDDSIYEDMQYKDVLLSEVKIASKLEKIFTEIKTNLKTKKIDETISVLQNSILQVDQDISEMKTYEKIHRHLDSEDNNVYKVLDNIKNKISIIQKVARNKFRKVTDEELDKIIEELSLTNTDKVAMLVGIYDMEV